MDNNYNMGEIIIDGDLISFELVEGERYQYKGDIDNSVSLAGRIGLENGYFYYRDVSDNIRRIQFSVEDVKDKNEIKNGYGSKEYGKFGYSIPVRERERWTYGSAGYNKNKYGR